MARTTRWSRIANRFANPTTRAGRLLQGFASRSRSRIAAVLGEIARVFSGGQEPTERDVAEAVELLEQSGYEVRADGSVVPPPIQDPTAPPQQFGGPAPAPGGAAPAPGGASSPSMGRQRPVGDEEILVDTRVRAGYDPAHAHWPGLQWSYTPQSSNVHAFAYDHEVGILYVQFHHWSPEAGRTSDPGPIYSYGGAGHPVPAFVYQDMIRASSKGKFVWDRLRIRGTLWGHQYPYTLVRPDDSGYVPRKATRRGLRVRTVPVAVAGRRTFRRSTLPQRLWG